MEMEQRNSASSNVQAWSSQSENMPTIADAEGGTDVDEPPDLGRPSLASPVFQKTSVRKSNRQSSLLTKALQHPSDDEDALDARPVMLARHRRRSMTSNISLASTADLTSDTGLTSPSRANTPSPPLPDIHTLQLHDGLSEKQPMELFATAKPEPKPEVAPRKRCISFACAAQPDVKPADTTQLLRPTPMVKAPSAQEAPRRSCIKFACPAPRPASTQNTPPRSAALSTELSLKATPTQKNLPASPARKLRPARPHFVRRSSKENRSSKTVNIESADLENDSTQFHEFASEKLREDDWIRQERQGTVSAKQKLTINDTLTKENHFRQIAKEAEEEAEAEENEDEVGAGDDDDDVESEDDLEDEEEEGDEEDEEEDDESEYGTDEGDDGYHTDEETGFAESDDEEDDDLDLWTPSQNPTVRPSIVGPVSRRSSIGEHQSDSSTTSRRSLRAVRDGKARRVPIRPTTPELPDSTDFVCGTLDEDRPMEEAYLSCIAARKAQKLHLIPQDIDPSFPASDPEDEDAEERFNPVHHDSDGDVWLHGEMEDLHHEERFGRKKSKAGHSPKRFHSPPPKRPKSPTKSRCRSPRPGQTSPRRARSPAPRAPTSSRASPTPAGPVVGFVGLRTRVGLTQTKSLPRPPAMFPQARHGKKSKATAAPRHVRGAIDIVKGLESKRQRRKEKFYQKYCNRARKGQIPERKPLPGRGAERMKELGLLMAGKSNTRVNYVMSV